MKEPARKFAFGVVVNRFLPENAKSPAPLTALVEAMDGRTGRAGLARYAKGA